MKRILSLLLCLALLVSAVPVQAFADGNDGGNIDLGGACIHPGLAYVEETAPDCAREGNCAYWYCGDCSSYWSDEDLTEPISAGDTVIPALGHDTVHVAAVNPSCTENGNVEYWNCRVCNTLWQDAALTQVTKIQNVTVPAPGHTVSHVAAVAPTEMKPGNLEYWHCRVCDTYWLDADLTKPADQTSVQLPATGHKAVYVEAVAPNCTEGGSIAYWYCQECDTLWEDAELSREILEADTRLPALGHELVHVEAVEANCTENGNIEHWYCQVCETAWQDAALTQITNHKNVITPAVGHDVVHVGEVWENCTENGNIEHWYCQVCETVWQDEALTQITNHKNVIIPAAGHDLIHVEGVAANCWENGNIEHWYCQVCEIVWQDEALTQVTNHKNVITPALGHDLVHVEAAAVSCTENGNIEHWYCNACEIVWQDEALTQVTNHKNVIVPAQGHTLVFVAAVAANCTETGNIEHWYCKVCETVWQDAALTQITNHKNVITPALGHDLVHVEAVAANCTENGNIEHWYCEACETVWQDEALTQLTNHKNVITPAVGHDLVHVEAVDANCTENGNIEHWYCEVCETVWQDAALTQITNHKNVITPAVGHDLVHVEAVAANCTENGNIEHWYCEVCETVWQDESLTQITNHKNVITPALGHELVHVEAVAANCTENGNIEHWYCEVCETVWQDAALTQITNHKNVITPALGHELVHVEAVAANCTENGNIEHWYCEVCEAVWQDEALTQLTNHKNVITPALGHDLVHVEAVAANCTENGNIEHWYCEVCEAVWQDEALTQITNHKNVITPALGHDLVHVEAVAANCTENGNIEHWYCEVCETVWQDAALTQITNHKNVITPALGHELVHVEVVAANCTENGNIEHWYCEVCETVWQDAALTQITNHKNVITPAPGHTVSHVAAVEPTGMKPGNLEYWHCLVCDSYWLDADLTKITSPTAVLLPATGHKAAYVEAVAPNCTEGGNIAYWRCQECGTLWRDAGLTQVITEADTRIPALGHELVHVEAVAANCTENGNVEHWYCEVCETVWQDEALTQITNHKNVITPALGHDLVHVEAVEANCTENGHIEHWYCEVCETVWQDAALTQITNHKNVITPALGHELVHVEVVAANCTENGNIEHWYCEVCETVWQDAALTQITNHKNVITPALGHELVHVEAVAANCTENGNIEHWYCEVCETVWQDAALTQLTNHKNVITPALGHDLVHVEAVAANCTENGNIEHWYCEVCETVWQDEALTQITNHKNVITPAVGHGLVHVEAVEANCTENGNIEHWYCEVCETVWQDAALTQITNHKNVITPALGHDLVHVEAVAANCTENGNIEHWYCEVCETVWQDEALTQITNHKNVITPAPGHTVSHVAAVEPTGMKPGNLEYWHCLVCDSYWLDADLTKLTSPTAVLLPATGHKTVHVEAVAPNCTEGGNIAYWRCQECGTLWRDAGLTQVITEADTRIPALGHELVHVEAVAANCTENGNIEHWYCEVCETVWQDEALTQLTNHKNVIVPALGHELVHVEVVAANCTENGNIEHWYCEVCETVWQDAALTQITNHKNVITPALGHDLVHVEAVAANCTENGNIEHWYCEACETVWQDEALTQLTNHKNVIVPALGHDLVHVEAAAANCTENGNIEHWYCKVCETVWQDEALTQLTNHKNVILPALGHDVIYVAAVAPTAAGEGNVEHWYCQICDTYWLDEALSQVTDRESVILPATGEPERILPLSLMPVVTEGVPVEKLSDGSYVIYLEKEDVADGKLLLSVLATARDEQGNEIPLGKKDLKWSTGDKRIATVAKTQYPNLAEVTVKAKTSGACVITAVHNKTKAEAVLTIHVRSYEPRLETASLKLNNQLMQPLTVGLVESYGNAVTAVSLHEYNSKTKSYDAQASSRFAVDYADGKLQIRHLESIKNGTHKLLLKAVCANGETYEYKLSLKVSAALPAVTVKQLENFNTFYRDSEARIRITAKEGVPTHAELDFGENAAFCGDYDSETGILTVRYSRAYLENPGKRNTKGSIRIFFADYHEPVVKSITLATEKKAPKLTLSKISSQVNIALAGGRQTEFTLEPYAETMTVTVDAPFASVSLLGGKVMLTLTGEQGGTAKIWVQDENWMESVTLQHKVTVQSKLPTVTLSRSKLTLSLLFAQREEQLLMTLSQSSPALAGSAVEPASKNAVANADKFRFDCGEDSITVSLQENDLPAKGSYEFKVTPILTDGTRLAAKTLTVTVEDKAPTVKLKTTTLKLNKNLNRQDYPAFARTAVTVSEGYVLVDLVSREAVDPDFRLTYDAETGLLEARLQNGQRKNGKTVLKLYPVVMDPETRQQVQLDKPVTLTLEVVAAQPKLTLKASGKLDTIVPGSAIRYTITQMTNIAGDPTDVRLEGSGAELFDVILTEDGAVVTLKEGMPQQKGKTYKLQLVFTIRDVEVAAKVSVKVNQSSMKFASVKAVNFYQSQSSRMAVVLTMTAPDGASVEDIWLGSKTAKQLRYALGEDAITWVDLGNDTYLVSIKVDNPGYLSYGKSYSLYLDVIPEGNAENAKPVSVKVTVKAAK